MPQTNTPQVDSELAAEKERLKAAGTASMQAELAQRSGALADVERDITAAKAALEDLKLKHAALQAEHDATLQVRLSGCACVRVCL